MQKFTNRHPALQALGQKLSQGLPLQPQEKLLLSVLTPVTWLFGLIFGLVVPAGALYSKLQAEAANTAVAGYASTAHNWLAYFWYAVAAIAGIISLHSVYTFWGDLMPKGWKSQVIRLVICAFLEVWYLLTPTNWLSDAIKTDFLTYFPAAAFVLIVLGNAFTMSAWCAVGQLDSDVKAERENMGSRLEQVAARLEAAQDLVHRYKAWFDSLAVYFDKYGWGRNGRNGVRLEATDKPGSEGHLFHLQPTAEGLKDDPSLHILLTDPVESNSPSSESKSNGSMPGEYPKAAGRHPKL